MKADWWQARRTVNILDHAHDIAIIAQKFDAALAGKKLVPVEDAAKQTKPIKLIPALGIFGTAAAFIIAKILGVF
jgi:hypothetical protein